jgi:hypothetical protein
MKNSKQQLNILRDYDKVKATLLHTDNTSEHVLALNKLVQNFQTIYGISSEYSKSLSNLFWATKKKFRSTNN